VIGAARTAIGGYLGSLKTEPEQRLAAAAIRTAIQRSGLDDKEVDQVIMGNVAGVAPNVARVGLLLAGLPVETPGYSVDRQCGSGLQAAVNAAFEIGMGQAEVIVAGGAECMSRIPFYLPLSSRYEAYRMGDFQVLDGFMTKSANAQPPDQYPGLNMGITAENVAKKYGVSRRDQDDFALDSQRKACAAIDAGSFETEIFPYEVKRKKDSFVFAVDEFPRRDTAVEKLSRLRPAFLDGGTVTAGNSSGMNDGAAALVIASEDRAAADGSRRLARILGAAVAGVDPAVMGLGPVPAIRKLLSAHDLALKDIDLFEINEAFAAQSLGVLKELGMAPGQPLYDRVNVNGGAIALGHPLGCSGARILITLIHELRARKGQYGVASLCIGGGQGIAVLVENCG
jgi:acetyl-CoA C-acetyltransferase